MFKSLLSAGLLAAAVKAQQTVDFVDEASGISFQNHVDPSKGVEFGIALPSAPSTDFIGRVSAPISEGYVAVSLGGNMIGRLLLVAWPNGNEVVSSFRQASAYANPAVLSGAAQAVKTIPTGTSITADTFTWTFVCEGCITGDDTAFSADDETTNFGWAFSTTEVADPSDRESDLNMHSAGFGLFGADLAAARSAEYETWAALAEDPTGGPVVPSPPPGNGTLPTPPEPPVTSPSPIGGGDGEETTPTPPATPPVTPPGECARRRKVRKMRKAKRAAAKKAAKMVRHATGFRA